MATLYAVDFVHSVHSVDFVHSVHSVDFVHSVHSVDFVNSVDYVNSVYFVYSVDCWSIFRFAIFAPYPVRLTKFLHYGRNNLRTVN